MATKEASHGVTAEDDLPFGGVRPSGMGAYHGIKGFRAMSHAKGVFVQGRWNLPSLLRAPFGKLVDLTLTATLGASRKSAGKRIEETIKR